MKNKTIFLLTFFSLFFVLLCTNCKVDLCKNVNCVNATCSSGICNCNDGYERQSTTECVEKRKKFLGQWRGNTGCTQMTNQDYTLTIKEHPTDIHRVILSGILAKECSPGTPWEWVVYVDETFPTNLKGFLEYCDNATYLLGSSNSGYLDADGKTLHLGLSLTPAAGGVGDVCVQTLIKI